MLSFSLITCTHNPDKEIFVRLIHAVGKLKIAPGSGVEWIVVDNNSSEKVQSSFDFSGIPFELHHVSEPNPGLTSARIAGIKKAKYDWIIFFDDDNEPSEDYLIEAEKVIEKYPQMGVWGPGKIEVVFCGKVHDFAKRQLELFQERNMHETVIDNVKWGQYAYPFGTGMLVRKEILIEYWKKIEGKEYSLTDRTGNSLSSGGDIQILLTGIKMGYYAGSTPFLNLKHNIQTRKTRFRKILDLRFALSSSALKVYNEVFPEDAFALKPINNTIVLKTIYGEFKRGLFRKNYRQILFEIYKKLGELNANIMASEKARTPLLLSVIQKIIN